MTILLCEDSPDGILSAVYLAYESRLGHKNIAVELEEGVNYQLFADYRSVKTDGEKAAKVASAIKRKLGEEAWRHIYHASLSDSREKADAIYRTVVLGLYDQRTRIMDRLAEPSVFQVFSLARKTANEAHRYLGFVRFREVEGEFLYSEISPENQVLPLIGEHFSNRFPKESFLIEDLRHESCLVHEAGRPWFLAKGIGREGREWKNSKRENEYARLWRAFHEAVSIEERRNIRLQQQFLPLKFRVYMTEIL